MAKKKKELIQTIGKRKSAIARATVKPGNGKIYIGNKNLDFVQPEIARLLITEPLVLAGDVVKNWNFDVNIYGGGIMGQAQAARQAIARALVEIDSGLKKKFLDYDRTLLIADVRRNEPHKPSRSKAGPRRHKQRSKR
jgi:small subunit ribosomal protein S9